MGKKIVIGIGIAIALACAALLTWSIVDQVKHPIDAASVEAPVEE